MATVAKAKKRTRPTTVAMKPMSTLSVAEISAQLQALQRQRAWHLKSRIMVANRLQATVAGTLGYHSGMKEGKERQAMFAEATRIIKAVVAGELASDMQAIILTTQPAVDGFEQMQRALEREMLSLVKQLPVAAWVAEENQRGFGLPMLAVIIGETGDLANYANPGKVWRRLGCAPWTHDDKTLMGATWKSGRQGKLPSDQWEAFGYSPRRRSIAYQMAEPLLKGNHAEYRQRYDETKLHFAETHPELASEKGFKLHCHKHAMLLMAKRLLRNLWIEWNNGRLNA